MVYCRSALHLPVFPSQLSTYSSLAGALTIELSPRFLNPRRQRVPQQKCKAPPGQGPLFPPILFDHLASRGQGVPIYNFIVLSTSTLEREVSGAHDEVLADLTSRVMTIRVMWQGYERLNWSRSIPVSSSLSRAQLGASIAMQLWSFIEDVHNTHSDTIRPEYNLASGKIKFEDIILLGLYNIYNDIWQIDLAVDIPFAS
ncbi:hypothetical protein AN958_04361 [Leucoagaricus sp. SymC.cos]|nr:hypothetical protein AN958_04361 [Leucoagaricus sp. SymC.cos]